MTPLTNRCIQAYEEHKHLKMAANDVGIPWQSVYVHLKKAGIKVVGDKEKYGSDKDKLAAKAEQYFKKIVPSAADQNKVKFQSKFDFIVGNYKVEIKASTLRISSKKMPKSKRWAFSSKKQ